MEQIKKGLRLLMLVFLILLATMGVGLAGGVPIPKTKRRNPQKQPRIELVEKKIREEKS